MTTTDMTAKDAPPAGPPPSPGPPPPYGPPIPLETAKRVMAAAETEALANGWPVVIAIFNSAIQRQAREGRIGRRDRHCNGRAGRRD